MATDADTHVDIVVSPCKQWAKFTTPYMWRLSVPKDVFRDGAQMLHTTARLGLPLEFVVANDNILTTAPDAPQKREKAYDTVDTPFNAVLAYLSLRTAPNKRIISSPTIAGNPRPHLMIRRMDGQDLHARHVHVMFAYIEQEAMRANIDPTLANLDTCDYEGFRAAMTPEKFVTFWETSEEGQGWSGGLECPVTLGCKACGKMVEKTMRCGKCTVVKYCDRVCQKAHWSEHKKVCFKP